MVTAAATPLVKSDAVPLTRVSAASRQALMCGLLTVATVLACRAWVEIGYIDDWSTARTAQLFAQTGHFVYNGWLHSPEGWQIVWTAPFIKFFGFSYAVVRLSMLPIVFATVYLFQRCLVAFGLAEKNASFGALTLGLSPIFVPAASSYMTDIPSLFALVLCLFFCQKSVTAMTNSGTYIWLTVAALTNLIFGTVRQTGWLGMLVIVPCVGLWLRHRRGVAAVGFTLTAICGAGVVGVLHWFLSHPYSVPEAFLRAPITKTLLVHLAVQLAWTFVYLMRCLLPILAMFLLPLVRIRRRTFWLIYFAFAALVLLVYTIGHRSGLDNPEELVRVSGKHQTINDVGVILKQFNVHLSFPAVVVALFVVGLVLLSARRAALKGTFVKQESSPQPSWRGIFWLLGPYSLIYLALLMPRGLVLLILERYIVALVPLPIVCLLARYQQRNNDQIPVFAVIVLTALAFFGVGKADRIYSENHARLIAANLLRGQGIPRTAISGGFEYDYETETDVSGHVNEPEVRVPANAYKPYGPPPGLPQCARDLVFSYGPSVVYTPSVVPKYFLVSSRRTCLAPTQYEPVSYKTMLPPFHRYIYIQQLPAK
jgi:hypothetical protein